MFERMKEEKREREREKIDGNERGEEPHVTR